MELCLEAPKVGIADEAVRSRPVTCTPKPVGVRGSNFMVANRSPTTSFRALSSYAFLRVLFLHPYHSNKEFASTGTVLPDVALRISGYVTSSRNVIRTMDGELTFTGNEFKYFSISDVCCCRQK